MKSCNKSHKAIRKVRPWMVSNWYLITHHPKIITQNSSPYKSFFITWKSLTYIQLCLALKLSWVFILKNSKISTFCGTHGLTWCSGNRTSNPAPNWKNSLPCKSQNIKPIHHSKSGHSHHHHLQHHNKLHYKAWKELKKGKKRREKIVKSEERKKERKRRRKKKEEPKPRPSVKQKKSRRRQRVDDEEHRKSKKKEKRRSLVWWERRELGSQVGMDLTTHKTWGPLVEWNYKSVTITLFS